MKATIGRAEKGFFDSSGGMGTGGPGSYAGSYGGPNTAYTAWTKATAPGSRTTGAGGAGAGSGSGSGSGGGGSWVNPYSADPLNPAYNPWMTAGGANTAASGFWGSMAPKTFGDWVNLFGLAGGLYGSVQKPPKVPTYDPTKQPGYKEALANIMGLVAQKGATDPARLNMLLQAVQRGSQSAQDRSREEAAMAGLQGSGVFQALQAATGQAGAAREAQLRAQETAQAEERYRQDLALLLNMLGINVDVAGLNMGAAGRNVENQIAWKAGLLDFLGQLSKYGRGGD